MTEAKSSLVITDLTRVYCASSCYGLSLVIDQGYFGVTHRVRLHLAMSLLHLLCNQKLHRRLVQPIGLVDRLSVFKKVHKVRKLKLKTQLDIVNYSLCV